MNIPMNEEEEYQFTELEPEGDVFGPASGKTAPSNSSIKLRRNILITIGIFLVILAVYKLLGVFFAPKKPPVQKITPPPIPKIVPPRPVPLPLGKDILRINALEAYDKQSKTQLQNLTSSVDNLQRNMNDANRQLSNINDSLQQISRQLDGQQKQIQALKPRKKPHIVRKPIHRKIYFVKAIIPGRAWLRTPDDTTLTISKGDMLPGYGMIHRIDADQGQVFTSSGIVIRFAPDDR